MKLTPQDIQEFKAIYREEFGEELSDAEAERRASEFLKSVGHVHLKERASNRSSRSSSNALDESIPRRTLESSSGESDNARASARMARTPLQKSTPPIRVTLKVSDAIPPEDTVARLFRLFDFLLQDEEQHTKKDGKEEGTARSSS